MTSLWAASQSAMAARPTRCRSAVYSSVMACHARNLAPALSMVNTPRYRHTAIGLSFSLTAG